jgi:hypothetical protein
VAHCPPRCRTCPLAASLVALTGLPGHVLQPRQYAVAMVADYLVVVSALEYVYDGKTRWPRAGTTAAFFAVQVRECLNSTRLIGRR